MPGPAPRRAERPRGARTSPSGSGHRKHRSSPLSRRASRGRVSARRGTPAGRHTGRRWRWLPGPRRDPCRQPPQWRASSPPPPVRQRLADRGQRAVHETEVRSPRVAERGGGNPPPIRAPRKISHDGIDSREILTPGRTGVGVPHVVVGSDHEERLRGRHTVERADETACERLADRPPRLVVRGGSCSVPVGHSVDLRDVAVGESRTGGRLQHGPDRTHGLVEVVVGVTVGAPNIASTDAVPSVPAACTRWLTRPGAARRGSIGSVRARSPASIGGDGSPD